MLMRTAIAPLVAKASGRQIPKSGQATMELIGAEILESWADAGVARKRGRQS